MVDEFIFVILAISAGISLRVLTLIGIDLFEGNYTSFDYLTIAILSLVCCLYTYIEGERPPLPTLVYLPAFLAIQRSQFFFMSLFIVVSLLIKPRNLFKLSLIAFVGFVVGFIALDFVSPEFVSWLNWKATTATEVFSSPLQGSFGVRMLEILNIVHIVGDKFHQILFGLGAGGFYNFDAYPFGSDMIIDTKSYSPDQLSSSQYHTVHSFIAFCILKYGFVGLFVYIWFCLYPFYVSSLGNKSKSKLFLLLSLGILSVYYVYASLTYQMLCGLFWAHVLRKEKRCR